MKVHQVQSLSLNKLIKFNLNLDLKREIYTWLDHWLAMVMFETTGRCICMGSMIVCFDNLVYWLKKRKQCMKREVVCQNMVNVN